MRKLSSAQLAAALPELCGLVGESGDHQNLWESNLEVWVVSGRSFQSSLSSWKLIQGEESRLYVHVCMLSVYVMLW